MTAIAIALIANDPDDLRESILFLRQNMCHLFVGYQPLASVDLWQGLSLTLLYVKKYDW